MNTPSSSGDRKEDDKMTIHRSDNVEGSPVEAIVGPSHSQFTWEIDKFSRLKQKQLYSEIFGVGRYKWQVLVFPKGNNVNYLSLYIDVADSPDLPFGWNRYAQFSLAVVNQRENSLTVRKETRHQFNHKESDWGFKFFMPLDEVCEPDRGYLANDTVVIEAHVSVHMIVDIWANDLIKDTGFVGLENQGATCSLNSLVQTLYHIPYFRKAVYQIPTEDDIPSQSVALALQILFFKLQHSDKSVATEDLTKSFGWSRNDSLTQQHDVHELNMKFSANLENKMQGTIVEGTMRELFEGHFLEHVKCTDVVFTSEKTECFKDLQLDVKECKDVYASFDKYTKVELLDGFNKYRADHHGLQKANKGVMFIDFPPVLQLQLKRFEFRYMSNRMVKINDRFEFPLQLDLDRDNGKYLSPEADRSVRNLYTLHSVLVHSGDVHGGHYYAFVRAGLANKWYKFNDDQVTEEDMDRKLEELYGDKNDGGSSAYMLVYIREGDKDKIICDVDYNDIPEHLRVSLRKEKEDKRRYEAQAYLFTMIKVARDEDLREQIGKDIFFDLVDHEKVRSFRVQRQMPFKHFKEVVANEFGLPVKFLRFWVWTKRENRTYRPHRPLTHLEEAQKVGQLRESLNKISHAALELFLEVEYGPDLVPIPLPNNTKEDLLLFFKFYDPQKEELRYVGRLFVNRASTPITIETELNRLAGFVPEQENHFFEERSFEPHPRIEVFYKMVSFKSRQMQNGDIICFQACRITNCERPIRFASVSSFLEMVKKRQVVHFRTRQRPKEDSFCLELAKFNTYDEVLERLAEQLSLDDPSRIMLTSHNFYTERPKPNFVEYGSADYLLDMLLYERPQSLDAFQITSGNSDILYYDVLDIPVPRPHGLKTLNIEFHYAMNDEVLILDVRLPTMSTVEDVIDEIKKKVELSSPYAEIRLFEVFDHRIYKVYALYELIDKINDRYWTLRAEEIPEGEDDLLTYEHLFRVHHFTKQTSQCHLKLKNFGEPFFLVVKDGETLAQVKGRIQKKLQVEDEEFSKWKFAVLFLGHPKYLQDTDVLTSIFERRETSPFESSLRREISGGRQPYICLEHSVDDQPGSSSH